MFLNGQQLKKVLIRAKREGYALTANNVTTGTMMRAMVSAASQSHSDCILQLGIWSSRYALGRAEGADLQPITRLLCEWIRLLAERYPHCGIALSQDHCFAADIDWVYWVIDSGLVSSMMIDGSSLPLEENIRLTRSVVERAHPKGVLVEGEVGRISGCGPDAEYTDPDQAVEFAAKTGVDLFSPAIGTNHGVSIARKVHLRYELLDRINAGLDRHGLSDIGMALHGASGLSAEHHHECIRRGVVKFNKDTSYQEAFARASVEFWDAARDAILPPPAAGDDFEPDKRRFDSRMYLRKMEQACAAAAGELMDICGSSGRTTSERQNV